MSETTSPAAERSRLRRPAIILLQLVLTALATWFILSRLGVGLRDVQELEARWWSPSLPMLSLASGTLIIGYVVSAALWAWMVSDLGGRRIPNSRAVPLFLTANLGRYIPGKVWQILGLTYLSRAEGVGARVAGAAAILGQLFALGGAALVGSAALAEGTAWHRGVAGVSVLVLTVMTVGFLVPGLRRRALSVLERWGDTEFDRPKMGAGFGLRWAVVYFLNWMIYAGAFWLFVRSYDPSVGFLETGPAFAAAYLLGYVFLPAPAGIGVREASLTTLLAPALGVSGALAISVTSRLWLTVVEVVPAALSVVPTLRRARSSPYLLDELHAGTGTSEPAPQGQS